MDGRRTVSSSLAPRSPDRGSHHSESRGLGVFQTLSQRLSVVSQETCSDVLTLIGLVRSGQAVTVLPESTLRELDMTGLHQTYLSGAASTTAFVWLTETGPTTLTKQFIEIMKETAD